MPSPLPTPGGPSLRRLLFNRYTLVAFVAGAVLAAGVGASALSGMGGCHHGMMMDGTHSAAEVSAHVDHMLKHFYVEIDATDAQKAQIGPLVKQAVDDLMPLHAHLHTAHTHAMQTLTPTAIDPGSLEASRGEHLHLPDRPPSPMTQLLPDLS